MDGVRPDRETYGANRNKITQLAVAGFVATAAMLLLAYMLPLMGIVSQDFSALYGALFNAKEAPLSFTALWWLGFLVHVALGTLAFPLAYDYLIDRRVLPNRPRLKGVLWGSILWFVVEAVVKTISGDGFFSSNMPFPTALSAVSLVCWLVYGALFEQMTRVRVVHEIGMRPRQAA